MLSALVRAGCAWPLALVLCVLGCSFLGLGRLFSGLGRLFLGLGCCWGVLVFCIFVSWSVVPLRLVPRFPRLCPWFVRSGGLASSVGSRWRFPVSPWRLGFARRSASRLLAPVSLRGCVAVWGVPGSLVGRSLRLAPRRLGCRSVRAVCLLAAFSCRCFRSAPAFGISPAPLLGCFFFLTFAAFAAPFVKVFLFFLGLFNVKYKP